VGRGQGRGQEAGTWGGLFLIHTRSTIGRLLRQRVGSKPAGSGFRAPGLPSAREIGLQRAWMANSARHTSVRGQPLG
jgi:hypothetical protein